MTPGSPRFVDISCHVVGPIRRRTRRLSGYAHATGAAPSWRSASPSWPPRPPLVLLRPLGRATSRRPGGAGVDIGARPAGHRRCGPHRRTGVARVPGDWPTWAELGMAACPAGADHRRPVELPARRGGAEPVAARAAGGQRAGADRARRARRRPARLRGRGSHARQPLAGRRLHRDATASSPTRWWSSAATRVASRRSSGWSTCARTPRRTPAPPYSFELRGDVPNARDADGPALARSPPARPTPRSRWNTSAGWRSTTATSTRRRPRSRRAAPAARQPGLLAVAHALAAARGDTAAAIADYRAALAKLPTPEYAAELGDLLAAAGDAAGAKAAYALVRAAAALPRDRRRPRAVRGRPRRPGRAALAAAQAATRRRSIVADALAWALHVRPRRRGAAVRRPGAALGTRNATGHYHRGMIRAALGDKAGARRT